MSALSSAKSFVEMAGSFAVLCGEGLEVGWLFAPYCTSVPEPGISAAAMVRAFCMRASISLRTFGSHLDKRDLFEFGARASGSIPSSWFSLILRLEEWVTAWTAPVAADSEGTA